MTRAFNWKIVFKTMGALMVIEGLFMAIATGVCLFYDDPDSGAFLVATIVTLVTSVWGLLLGHRAPKQVGEREGYVIVACVWVVFSIFGMLPYYLSGAIPSFTDAWFETMSGFTTTGATVLADVESLTHGALFWRSMTQWIGGMGIIVLSIAILPMFGLGGMQLYAAEVTGLNYEKISPRIADTAKWLWGLYIILTAAEFIILSFLGMSPLDAICHSFSTIATGGFSTQNLSIQNYSAAIQYTIAIFMLLSGINFALMVFALRGRTKRLLQDEETKWYLSAVTICVFILFVGLFIHYSFIDTEYAITTLHEGLVNLERAFRKSFFMVTSAMTSTGFAASDYMTWPKLLWVLVFFMMFTGASSGSTSGGIKWIRIAIFAKSGITEFKRRIHPNAIVPVKLNGQPLNQTTINNVMGFMVFYIFILVLTVLIFCACGVNFDESIGTAVSAIGNVGVSIGQFGPAGSYATFPTIAKWWMTFVMLIGRLEIFTILLLFTRALWRK